MFAPSGQDMVEQAPQHLHRHVLEGERRTVEQLEQPVMGAELLQECYRRMAEPRIGISDETRQGAWSIASPTDRPMTVVASSG